MMKLLALFAALVSLGCAVPSYEAVVPETIMPTSFENSPSLLEKIRSIQNPTEENFRALIEQTDNAACRTTAQDMIQAVNAEVQAANANLAAIDLGETCPSTFQAEVDAATTHLAETQSSFETADAALETANEVQVTLTQLYITDPTASYFTSNPNWANAAGDQQAAATARVETLAVRDAAQASLVNAQAEQVTAIHNCQCSSQSTFNQGVQINTANNAQLEADWNQAQQLLCVLDGTSPCQPQLFGQRALLTTFASVPQVVIPPPPAAVTSAICTPSAAAAPAAPIEIPDGTYTMVQQNTGRFLDAFESGRFLAATRTAQNNDSQEWIFTSVGTNAYTIQQKVNNRYLDAFEDAGNGYLAATRSAQGNDSQEWIATLVSGTTWELQQKVNNRYLDAFEDAGNDWRAATRPAQNNDSQHWVLSAVQGPAPAPPTAPPTLPPTAPPTVSTLTSTTSCTLIRGENDEFLDRQNVASACGSARVLNQVRLVDGNCPGRDMLYQFQCVGATGGALTQHLSGCTQLRGERAEFLDRQLIQCPAGSALNSFQMVNTGCAANDLRYRFFCKPVGLTNQVTRQTPCNSIRQEPLEFIDRHNIDCNAGEALAGFRMVANGCSGRNLRFNYFCGQL